MVRQKCSGIRRSYLDEIKQAGYDIVTPVIITNSEAWDGLQISDRTHILSGDAVMSLSR